MALEIAESFQPSACKETPASWIRAWLPPNERGRRRLPQPLGKEQSDPCYATRGVAPRHQWRTALVHTFARACINPNPVHAAGGRGGAWRRCTLHPCTPNLKVLQPETLRAVLSPTNCADLCSSSAATPTNLTALSSSNYVLPACTSN